MNKSILKKKKKSKNKKKTINIKKISEYTLLEFTMLKKKDMQDNKKSQ